MSWHELTRCRACGASGLVVFLDLGHMPLANNYLRPEELGEEPRFPLRAAVCSSCYLVQLKDIVSPDMLFREYAFMTSASFPVVDHFRRLAKSLAPNLRSSDLVVDIASNDGTFLSFLQPHARVLGIDPAKNIAEIAQSKGVETLADFFSARVGQEVRAAYGSARLVFAANVLGHVDDLDDFFTGVNALLADDGEFVFEVHWVKDLIENHAFDQIYHEHVSYFGIRPVETLLERFGMAVVGVEQIHMQGESLRVVAKKQGSAFRRRQNEIDAIQNAEIKAGVYRALTYEHYAEKVGFNRVELRMLLDRFKRRGKKVAGYGAPAKSAVLLNAFDIGPDIVSYLIDTTPFKQGRLSPGKHLPIHPPEFAESNPPDCYLLCAWNYQEAILNKESAFRARGGKFILPIPDPRIV